MKINREIFCNGRRQGVYKLIYDNRYYWSYIPTVEYAPRLDIKSGRGNSEFGNYGFSIPFEEDDLNGDF